MASCCFLFWTRDVHAHWQADKKKQKKKKKTYGLWSRRKTRDTSAFRAFRLTSCSINPAGLSSRARQRLTQIGNSQMILITTKRFTSAAKYDSLLTWDGTRKARITQSDQLLISHLVSQHVNTLKHDVKPKNYRWHLAVLWDVFSEIHYRLRSFYLSLHKIVCVLPDEVTMKEVGQAAQLRAGELIIIVVVLIMWAGKWFMPIYRIYMRERRSAGVLTFLMRLVTSIIYSSLKPAYKVCVNHDWNIALYIAELW